MGKSVLEGDDHRVTVQGRLQDGGPVVVEIDGDRRVITRDDGRVTEGAVSVTLHGDGGLHVEEGAVSQEITLPDGTFIRRGAATDRVVLADGTALENSPGTDGTGNGATLSVTMNGSRINVSSASKTTVTRSTDGELDVSHAGDDAEVETATDADDDGDDVDTPDAFFQAALAVFFGGLFAAPALGFEPGLFGAAGIAGTLYYGLATAYHARGSTSGDADTVISGVSHLAAFVVLSVGTITGAFSVPAAIGAGLVSYFGLQAAHSGLDAALPERDEAEGDDLDDVREELADLQAEYLDADGDVETIDEYEARVGEILDGKDVDPEDVEIERVPETETA